MHISWTSERKEKPFIHRESQRGSNQLWFVGLLAVKMSSICMNQPDPKKMQRWGKASGGRRAWSLQGLGLLRWLSTCPVAGRLWGHYIDFVTREERSEVDSRMMGREEIRRIQVMLKYVWWMRSGWLTSVWAKKPPTGWAVPGVSREGRLLRLRSVTQWWLGPVLCLCTAH